MISICFVCFFILIIQYAWTIFLQRNLDKVKQESEKASNDLMLNAYNALQSDAIKHMVHIQQLLDTLSTIEGTLVKYEVKGGKTEWEALVPKSFTQGVGPVRGQVQPQVEPDGRVRIKGH